MKTTLQLWLHQVNRVALFLSLSFGVACAHLPARELATEPAPELATEPAPELATEPVSMHAGGAVNGIAWSASAAESATLAQVVTGGDKCYGKACKVSTMTYTASGVPAFRNSATATTFYLDLLPGGSTVWACGSGICNYSYAIQTSGSQPITSSGTVVATSYLQSLGLATGSLPACAGVAGGIVYDTTTATVKKCNGTAWHTMGEHPAFYSAFAPSGLATGTREVQRITFDAAATVTQLGATAVTAGTGAGNYTVDVYNATTTTSLCTSSAILCSAAVPNNDNVNCSGNVSAGDQIALRILSTGCTTSPAVTITGEFTSRD